MPVTWDTDLAAADVHTIGLVRTYSFRYSGSTSARVLSWELLPDLDLLLIDPSSTSAETRFRPADGTVSLSGDEVVIVLFEPGDDGFMPGKPERRLTDDDCDIVRAAIERAEGGRRPFVSSKGISDAASRYASAVAHVAVLDENGDERGGTGFLYGSRDLLVTAEHVVRPSQFELGTVEFCDGSVSRSAEIVGVSREMDVAVLRLDEPVPARPLVICRPGDDLRLGTRMLVIGYPRTPGLRPARVYQEVVPASRSLAFIDNVERFLLSMPLLGGFSGSPVIDDGLLLAGMITEAPEDGLGGSTPNVYPALMVSGDAISSVADEILA